MCLIITAGFSRMDKTCLFHQFECCIRGRTRCFRKTMFYMQALNSPAVLLTCLHRSLTHLSRLCSSSRRCSCRDALECSEATTSAPFFTVTIIKLVLILGNPGATSRADAIFSGESLLQVLRSPWELILTEPVPEVVEFRSADWAEKYFSAQSAERNSTTSGTGSVRISSQGLFST